MYSHNSSDELSLALLTHDFNSQSFILSLRRQNEKYRETFTLEYDRQHPFKYSSFGNPRGFARMIKTDPSTFKSSICSKIINKNGILATDHLSKQLLDLNLSVTQRHLKKSRILFSDKMKHIHSDFNSQTNLSLRKVMNECQRSLLHYISKYRSR